MRLFEISKNDTLLDSILETSGASSAGNVASLPMSMGVMVRRMPTEPNLFGYVKPKRNKSKKKRKIKH
jgi:hypothetical protein